MKYFYNAILSAVFIFLAFTGYSQTPAYAKNTGATGNNTFAWGGGTTSKKVQLLYLPTDFSPAIPSGTITKLYFMYGNTGNTAGTDYTNLVINLGQTTNTTFSPATTFYTGLTNVLSASSYTVSAGTSGTWFEVQLQNPFPYDASKTLIVEIYFDGFVNSSSTSGLGTYSGTSVTGRKLNAATTTATTGSASNNLQNMGLHLQLPPCTAPPTAGEVNSTVAAACPGNDFTLSLSGHSVGDGQNYQWQRSTDGTTWINLPGNADAITLNQGADNYYRAIVTCSGQSDTTAPLFVGTYLPMNGTNYTVNSSMATNSTNFRTFQDLAARLNCAGVTGPVTVTVQPGTYSGRIVLNSIVGASSSAPIIINGNGQSLTYSPSSSTERTAITLNGTQYCTIQNLVLNVAGGTYGWGILLTGGSANNSLLNNTINGNITGDPSNNYAGIVASGSATTATTLGDNASNTTISGNTIKGGMQSIILAGSSTLSAGNVISGNTLQDFGQDGIHLLNQNGAQVLNNDISRPTRTKLNFFRGIYLTGGTSQNNLIRNNKIHDSHTGNLTYTGSASGIQISSADAPPGSENKVINNLVYRLNGEGDQYGINNSNSDGNFNYHNTVIMDDQSATDGDSRAFYQNTAATNVQFKNNIAYVTRSGAGVKVAMFFSTTTSTIASDYNVIYVKQAPGYHVGSWGSNTAALQTTMANWQSVNGGAFDPASAFADPVFSNPAANNYTPTNIAVSDKGTNLSITEDINNNPRSITTPDAGAIEWAPVQNDAAIVAFVQPATATYCNATVPAIFTLTNTGSAVLNSVTINWTVNGVAQSAVTQTGLNLAPGASTNITLGNPPVTLNTLYQFAATASLPNGVADENAANNSFTSTTWRTSLSGAYTVNKNAAVSGTNYTSLQEVAKDLRNIGICGPVTVTVQSGSGPYTEQLTITSIAGASATNTVVFDGSGETVQATPTATLRHIIKIRGASYVTLQNFVINSQDNTYGWGINLNGGVSKIKLMNNVINVSQTAAGSEAMGISVSDSASYLTSGGVFDSITIANNTINGGYVGINVYGAFASAATIQTKDVFITNNIIRDVANTGINILGVNNSRISRNDISRPARPSQAGSGNQFYGIYIWNANYNYLVEKNIVHDINNASIGSTSYVVHGVYLVGNNSYSSNGTVANNLVYNITNASTQYGIYLSMSGPASANIYHNTIVLDDASFTGTANTYALYNGSSTALTGQIDIKNNLFYIARAGLGNKRMVDFAAPASSTLVFDYNVYYFGTNTGTLQFGKVNTNNYTDFAAWNGAGYDMKGTYANPMFTGTAAGNYIPSNSAVDGATILSLSVGVTDDILNVVRSTNPDPGAFEFTVPLPVTVVNFSGEKQGAINKLYWTTATEANNAGFELQRSADGVLFSKIGLVPSKSPTGNSVSSLQYQLDDVRPLAANNYYRLKQVDKDGKATLSNVVLIKGLKPAMLTIANMYPNPVANMLTVIVVAPQHAKVNLVVTDVEGKTILSQAAAVVTGDNVLPLNVRSLAKGTYFLTLYCDAGCAPAALRFVKQ